MTVRFALGVFLLVLLAVFASCTNSAPEDAPPISGSETLAAPTVETTPANPGNAEDQASTPEMSIIPLDLRSTADAARGDTFVFQDNQLIFPECSIPRITYTNKTAVDKDIPASKYASLVDVLETAKLSEHQANITGNTPLGTSVFLSVQTESEDYTLQVDLLSDDVVALYVIPKSEQTAGTQSYRGQSETLATAIKEMTAWKEMLPPNMPTVEAVYVRLADENESSEITSVDSMQAILTDLTYYPEGEQRDRYFFFLLKDKDGHEYQAVCDRDGRLLSIEQSQYMVKDPFALLALIQ